MGAAKSITGGQTNSNGAMTLGADRFSDTCNCGPGFYFEQSNDQWSNAQYSNTGAKDYLLPCQPCADGTFKSTADLQDDSACTSCYDIDHASAKLDNGDKSYEDHTSFPVRSTIAMIMLCMCTYLHVTTPSLPWFQQCYDFGAATCANIFARPKSLCILDLVICISEVCLQIDQVSCQACCYGLVL